MLKIGMIGAGRMGNLHKSKLVMREDVSITAVCDVIEERAFKMAREVGAKVYYDYKEMLDKEELDVIYINTPTITHPEMVKEVIQRKIHLFLEKPLALDLKVAFEMKKQVEESGIICTVGHMYRYRETVQQMLRLLAGKPIAMLNAYWYWTIPPVPHIADKDIGGGPVVDQIVHLIDLCRLAAGEIDTVRASYTLNCRKDEDFNNWDGYAVNLTFKSGAVASVTGTLALFKEMATQTFLENIVLDIAAKNIMTRFTPKTVQVFTANKVEIIDTPAGDIDHVFIDAVKANDPSMIKCPIGDAIKTLAVTLAANHSAQTGQIVKMDDFIHERLNMLL